MINHNEVRRINNTLAKNRKILVSLTEESSAGCLKIKKDALTDRGFVFKYQTQTKKYKSGLSIMFCYDYYYFELNGGWLVFSKTSF